MGHCNICGTEQKFPFECAFCGGNFCVEHKYPDNHQCPTKKTNATKAQAPKTIKMTTYNMPKAKKDFQNSRPQDILKPKFSIGKYDVYEELGHGGFGVVYLVYSQELRGFYALKTFKETFLQNSEVRRLFQKEASIWVDLDHHPNIVRAYAVNEINGKLHVAMEYIAKDNQGSNTLEDYLRKQPPDLSQSMRWAIQFCHGMEYAYSKGLRCHRDIKPANIMITKDKTLKISDFGLAGILSSSEIIPENEKSDQEKKPEMPHSLLRGKVAGTPAYMSPEQRIDAGSSDQRSDIYSFGVVLAEMFASGKLRSNPQFLTFIPSTVFDGVDPLLSSNNS